MMWETHMHKNKTKPSLQTAYTSLLLAGFPSNTIWRTIVIMLNIRSPNLIIFSPIQFTHSVMPYFLRPNGLQHDRLPCPSPTPGACSNSCPLSRWCHPTISSSVIPFSSFPQSFPASGSFQMSQFFASGGQSVGASVSASVLPVNI